MFNRNSALLCIDIQKGLDEPNYYGTRRNNPQAENNIQRIISEWRLKDLPIYHVKHNSTLNDSPLRPGQKGNEFKSCALPLDNEPIIEKDVNSAFIGTDLKERLISNGLSTVIIVGLTTEHCISTTTRMAGNLGFTAYLISDATAAFDKKTRDGSIIPAETVHQVELNILDGEFCTVISTEECISLLKQSF